MAIFSEQSFLIKTKGSRKEMRGGSRYLYRNLSTTADVPHLRVNMATLAEQIQMLPQIVHDVRITNVSATILLVAQALKYSFNLVPHLYVELNLYL